MTSQGPTEPQANQQEEIGQIRKLKQEKKTQLQGKYDNFLAAQAAWSQFPVYSFPVSSFRWII